MKTNAKRIRWGRAPYKLLTFGILSASFAGLVHAQDSSAISIDNFLEGCDDATVISAPFMETSCGALKSWQPAGLPAQGEDGSQISYLENDDSIWGYDGLGLVFTDESRMIKNADGSLFRQKQIAKRGETVGLSLQVKVAQYPTGDTTKPIEYAHIFLMGDEGGEFIDGSLEVRVGDTLLPPSEYSVEYSENPSDTALEWAQKIDLGKVSESGDVLATINYSVYVSDNAPYEIAASAGADIHATNHYLRQTVMIEEMPRIMLDGNLVISRTDQDGKPLAGATYSIDGVTAVQDKFEDNNYVFSPNGNISQFITGDDGTILVKGLPEGEYTVREVSAPEGHSTQTPVITKEVTFGNSEFFEYSEPHYYVMGMDYKTMLERYGDVFSVAYKPGTTISLSYDSSQNAYIGSGEITGSGFKIEHRDDRYYWTASNGKTGEFTKDKRSGELYATLSMSDLEGIIASLYEGLNLVINDDGTASSGSQEVSVLDESDGCYHMVNESGDALICPDGEAYVIVSSANFGDFKMYSAERMISSEKNNIYDVVAGDLTTIVIRSIDENSIIISENLALNHLPQKDMYYNLAWNGVNYGFVALSTVLEKTNTASPTLATQFRFTDKTADSKPEDILNPQTSDTLTRAACIILAATTSAFVIGRKLSRR